MTCIHPTAFVGTLVSVFAACCSPSWAIPIIIGTDTVANEFPFTDPTGYVGEYQQVYNAALFPGSGNITAISFFAVGTSSISGDFILSLSTTSATPHIGGLSDVYANNIGPNNQVVFTGTVSDVLSFDVGPFFYNPLQGNLLLDVDVISETGSTGFLEAGCSTDTNRVYNFGGSGNPTQGGVNCGTGIITYGLKTNFAFTPVNAVPEMGTIGVFGVGLLFLIGFGSTRISRSYSQKDEGETA